MKLRNKILTGLAGLALAGAVAVPAVADSQPAEALTSYYTVNCSMYASNLNALRVINFTTGNVTIKAYAANGALISSKTSSAGTIWAYGNRTSYTRFVVTGVSFGASPRCA